MPRALQRQPQLGGLGAISWLRAHLIEAAVYIWGIWGVTAHTACMLLTLTL